MQNKCAVYAIRKLVKNMKKNRTHLLASSPDQCIFFSATIYSYYIIARWLVVVFNHWLCYVLSYQELLSGQSG